MFPILLDHTLIYFILQELYTLPHFRIILGEAMAGGAEPRASPVIIITGTPGTGKSTHAQLLAAESPIPLQYINVSEWVKEMGLHEGFDEEWQSLTVDEDKVVRSCKQVQSAGINKRSLQASL